jgi:hypothetical protein
MKRSTLRRRRAILAEISVRGILERRASRRGRLLELHQEELEEAQEVDLTGEVIQGEMTEGFFSEGVRYWE